MGQQNVARALMADVPATPKLVLVTMALHSLDPGAKRGEPLHYFGGWPLLAIALGFHDYTPVAKATVGRAVSTLVDKGYVKPVDYTARGVRVYALHGLPGAGDG